ncbi:hypothetical protein EDD18DRAFT_1355885 [Armillaria luteobubalina]|uniref:Uncharacterized protein n=1 Tax=Armillaria luteobubalina TaxID=153913 RepID=A0AA39URA5_9AGAR|nr:hypothetical protein EDD18DRAFT_1355885 [Armillaria luteobubalina]
MLAIHKHLKDVRDHKKHAKLSDLASGSAAGDDMVIDALGNSEGMSALSTAQVKSDSDKDVLGTELDQFGDILATEPTVRPPGTVTIEEVEDIDLELTCQWHYQWDFPDNKAGAPLHHGKTTFQHIRNKQILKQEEVLGPFQDDEEWELAKWLIKNMGHSAAEEFLKLPMISLCAQPQYKTKQQLYNRINDLPQGEGTNWKCYEFEYEGNIPDNKDPSDMKMKKENLEMWFHNPLKIVCELISNPVFKDVMAYAPIQMFMDPEGQNQVFNEMWMDNTYYNIAKDTHHQLSLHAIILLGYLPIPKFDCYTKKLRSIMKYRLFHHCMTIMMKSIADAGCTGVEMVCADALVCFVYPIFAVYIADYPEQCLDHAAGKDVNTIIQITTHLSTFLGITPDLLHQLHKGVFKDHLVKWCTAIIGAIEVDKAFWSMPSHPGLGHFKNGISHVSQWTSDMPGNSTGKTLDIIYNKCNSYIY